MAGQLFDARRPGAGHGLVGRDVDPLDPHRVVDGLQSHHHLNGRAVRVGDEVGRQAVGDPVAVHFRHHEGDAVVHAELRRVVDHDRAGIGSARGVVGGNAAACGEQRHLRVGEIEVVEHLHGARPAADLEALARGPLAGEQANVVDRKRPLVENLAHGLADCAGGADDRDVQFLHRQLPEASRGQR